ncbi:radical SAM protein [Patescibacteria group bacterium]|nr:radical SAM protein [Patescibacteria group bacterium]
MRDKHPLYYLFWECTLNCNFLCKHCGSSAGNTDCSADQLTTDEIKNTFKEISDNLDATKIMLAVTGGEPLLRNDIFEVMKYANNLGFNWGMVTNGFLVNEDIVRKMKDSGMSSIVVSIDGIKETHDNFRRMPKSFDKAINAVKIIKKANFVTDLQITTSVHRKNFSELKEMYQTFLPLGIDSWRVINVDSIGRADENKDILLKPGELKRLLTFIKEKRKKHKDVDIKYGCTGFLGHGLEKKVRDHYFFCNTGITSASILYNGDIFVCPNVPRQPELIQGNVRKDRFSDIWNNKFKFFRDKNRTSCNDCQNCEHWENCLGGSMHLWDFDKNKPKMCHLEYLNK